jgi:hypothetical protein
MVFQTILKREQMHQNCYTVHKFPKLFVLVVFSFVYDCLCSGHCISSHTTTKAVVALVMILFIVTQDGHIL